MRGRKPKPIAVQIAEGDPRKRGRRKLEEEAMLEPNVKRGLPECPRHLRGLAKATWLFFVRELVAMGIDCRPDAVVLEGACVAYARAVEADTQIRAEGTFVKEPVINPRTGEKLGDRTRVHPGVAISKEAWSQVRQFCSEFGFSPVSRTRIHLDSNDKGAEDDLAALLAGPRPARVTSVQ